MEFVSPHLTPFDHKLELGHVSNVTGCMAGGGGPVNLHTEDGRPYPRLHRLLRLRLRCGCYYRCTQCPFGHPSRASPALRPGTKKPSSISLPRRYQAPPDAPSKPFGSAQHGTGPWTIPSVRRMPGVMYARIQLEPVAQMKAHTARVTAANANARDHAHPRCGPEA